jgi:alkanesulfonate monooxygenase SsuD/methylene tetrahydromethanopterin reductase-like flavin-dependent oxidoreductase (luciferase family)
MHLGAHPGLQTDFESLAGLARAAERGSFDFILLPGPEAFPMSAALAAVTDRLGLVAAVDPASDEPFGVARRLATLDHLSAGRAGWHVATALDAGGAARDAEFIAVVRAFLDGWGAGAVRADESAGVYADPSRIHPVEHRGAHFDVRGFATVPAGPQGHPILLHDDAAAEGRAFRTEGDRNPNGIKVFPIVTVVLGDTQDQAADGSRLVGTAQQVAAEMERRMHACDGFVLAAGSGLDEFVAAVVPVLRERGVFRRAYDGVTLRGHLEP